MPSSRAKYSIGFFIPLLAVALWFGIAPANAGDHQRAVSPAAAATPSLAAAQSGERVGDDTCVTCHEKEGQAYGRTLHARAPNPRAPAATEGCETCHGPGKAHVDAGGDKTTIRVFTAMSPREVSEICASCHNRATHANWQGSPHDSRNMSCITCHSVHSPRAEKAQLKAASEIETCAACHRQQAMKVNRTQHMPVREGKMACTSCHNPHGSTNVRQLKVGNWINESCTSCHTEKRGPFLWEHAAGRESCITCHDPHGSSNDRMLVAKAPMLCQRCHIGTRHPSTIYDGKNAVSVATASNRLYGRACVNCHSNIHGSNHPSGNAFLR